MVFLINNLLRDTCKLARSLATKKYDEVAITESDAFPKMHGKMAFFNRASVTGFLTHVTAPH